MIKLAKIVDDTSKMCNIGIGTDIEYYKSIGMEELDVEQAYNGNWYIVGFAPQKPVELSIKEYELAVQRYLDETAQSKGYDNTYTCLSYLNSTDEKWKTESTIFNSWRDSVWQKCHEILNAFIAGELTQPTIEEVIEALPKIEW